MLESEEDRRDILRSLGGQCYPTTNGPLLAIFDNEYIEALGSEARVPMLTCTAEEAGRLEMLRKGAPVTIGLTAYRVRRYEPDGTGMCHLILES